MAIAAPQASAMVGAIDRGLVAACDRLPVDLIARALQSLDGPFRGCVQKNHHKNHDPCYGHEQKTASDQHGNTTWIQSYDFTWSSGEDFRGHSQAIPSLREPH